MKPDWMPMITNMLRFLVKRELGLYKRRLDEGASPRWLIWRLKPTLSMLDELSEKARAILAQLNELDRKAALAEVAEFERG
jgi:hypothetical protein